jgi:hypothetical protein
MDLRQMKGADRATTAYHTAEALVVEVSENLRGSKSLRGFHRV